MEKTRNRIIAGLTILVVAVGAYVATRSVASEDAAAQAPASATPSATQSPSSTPSASDPPGEPIEFEITRACAQTVHQPLNGSPSQVVWVYDAPGLPNGSKVDVTDENQATIETTVVDGKVTAKFGVPAYGNYRFPRVSWIDSNDIENTIDVDGSHVVDEREGKPSETCIA